MNLSNKLQYLRAQRGYSQEILAEKLHVRRQTVSKWEQGSSAPDADMIVKLSELFHVSTDLLLKDNFQIQDANHLDRVVIEFLNSAQDMDRISKELVSIARDGVVDEVEQKRVEELLNTVDEVIAVVTEIRNLLSFSQEHNNE